MFRFVLLWLLFHFLGFLLREWKNSHYCHEATEKIDDHISKGDLPLRKNVDVEEKISCQNIRAIDSRFDSRQKFDRKWAATEVDCFDAFSASLFELDKHKGHHYALSAVRIICTDVTIHCCCLFLFLTWQKKKKKNKEQDQGQTNKQTNKQTRNQKNKQAQEQPLFKQAQLPQSLRYYRSVTACVCLYQKNIKVTNCAFSPSYNWFRLLIQCCCLFMFLTWQKQVSYYQRIRPMHLPFVLE